MVVIILTPSGLAEMTDNLTSGTNVWLNPDLITKVSLADWQARGLELQVLPNQFDADKEKSVIAALDYVEKHSNDPHILIEYP